MKFNKAWIDELVPTSLSAEELAAQITMAGLEVVQDPFQVSETDIFINQ